MSFPLTAAQSKVIDEIREDLGAKHPMNRLLQGDVGSGKTVVAIAAILLVVEAGFQTALMAPTQILAEQHYDVLRLWLEPLGVRLAIRTAARQEESVPPLITGAENPNVIIGTHALLYETVEFSNLGLVVIDEQHKFGVAQRARLTAREPAPDVLVMTATPIPRTLTMTVYGDLDVSVIDEMPRNRGKIITAARDESKLGEVLGFVREQLEAGRQAYMMYPLIDESEKLDVKAAAAEFELWRERLHPYRCELLHGRIPAAEKQAIMERFRRGDTKVLISTTVIEVGVDVPNATIMLGRKRGALWFGPASSTSRAHWPWRAQVVLYSAQLGKFEGNRIEAGRIGEDEQWIRGRGSRLGTARSRRLAWDRAKWFAGAQDRRSQAGRAVDA